METPAKVYVNLDDPDGFWKTAIECWVRGEKGRLLLLLANDKVPVTASARMWIAEALLGRVKVKKGRRRYALSERQRMQLWELFDYAPEGKELPRTRAGYEAASKMIGVPARTIEKSLPKLRSNARKRKTGCSPSAEALSGANPFGLTNTKKLR